MTFNIYSSPDELNRIVRLFDGCQELDDFETTVQSAKDKWKDRLNNAAQYRLCRMCYRGSYPVAIPEMIINNLHFIRLTSRVTTVLQNERIVVRITSRKSTNSPEAEGVIEGKYSIDEKYSMLPKSSIDKIIQRKPRNFRVCQLQLEGSQQGWAVPLEASDELEKVELKGRTNCGRACQGDTVLVEVLANDEENPRLGHGRVVGVLRQQEKLLYKLFVCELMYDEGTFMRPLCKSFPKIGYDNRHARECYRKKYEQNVYQNQGFQLRRATGIQNQDEKLIENPEKFANLHYVSVYNPRKRLVDAKAEQLQGQRTGKKTREKTNDDRGKFLFEFSPYERPFKVQKHQCDNLFIVCFLGWSVNQFYPSGKVVHVFNRVDKIDSTLEVLILKHSLPRKMIETTPVRQELEKLKILATDLSDHVKRKDYRSHFTITIDNPDTKDMDDAISFQYDALTRIATVGVHITDVSYYIQKDSHLDKLGRNRVVTIYPPKMAKQAGVTPNHLFPTVLSESILSLVEGKDRRCLSTVFEFKRDPTGEWDLRRKTPAITLIRSDHRLNKEDVHDILLGRVPDSTYSTELIGTLRHLWSIAKELRIHRMGAAAFVLRDRSSEDHEIGDKFEASALVEEFMVLANRTVGEFLASSKYLEPFTTRVQDPPRDVDIELWRTKFEGNVLQSAELTRYYRNLSISLDPRLPRQRILAFKDDSQLLQQLCHQDPRGAALMLFSETRFPHLFLAISDWHRISRPASYVEFQSQGSKLHFDLQIENYLHFTSPLRRYPDILVHRALRAQLESQVQGKVESIQDLAEHMNVVVQRNKRYEKDCRCFEFAELSKSKPQCLLAVIRELSEDAIVFTSTASDFLPSLSNTMPLRFLSLADKPAISGAGNTMRLKWKKRIFCHPSSERWNSFIEHGIEPSVVSEASISNMEYCICMDFSRVAGIKEQLFRCQGNYDDIRQTCARSANEIMLKAEQQSGTFFVSSESRVQDHLLISNHSIIIKDVQLGDVMRVQYYNIMSGGLLTPTIQTIELCETVDMCAAHRMRPVASFERTAEKPSVSTYKDVEHYAKLWLPIISMESATVAAAADDSFIVHDVELKWKRDEKNNRLLGLFCLTEEYCQNRSILFSDSVFNDPNRNEKLEEHKLTGSIMDPADEAFSIAESMKILRYAEYICLRSKQSSHTWVGHGGIVAVYITPHTKSVMCGAPKVHICRFIVFHLNEVSCDSRVLQENLSRATVEILYKFLPSRRQEIAVLMLGDMQQSNIASGLIRLEDAETRRDKVGDWTIYLQELSKRGIRHFRITVPSDMLPNQLETIPCNESQNHAISKAMTSPVTLIWGPPGTGKTSTGVMLTFWYVYVNRCIDKTWNEAENYYDDNDDDDENAPDDIDAADAGVAIDYANLGVFHNRSVPGADLRHQERLQSKSGGGRPKEGGRQLLQTRRQVLYCGPSNASVDVVASYLQSRLRIHCPRIVRVASEQIELRKYPVPGERQKSKVNAETEISPQLEQITLHHVVRLGNSKRARLLKSFDMLFRSFMNKPHKTANAFTAVLTNLLPSCPDLFAYLESHLKEYTLLSDQQRNEPFWPGDMDLATVTRLYRLALSDAKARALQRYEVVLCTTSVSSSGLLQKACKFAQIIIDEAGMCTQPETLVPIVGYLKAAATFTDEDGQAPSTLASHHAERVVLIGDHKQLCPIIQNKTAALLGLRKSFLEYNSDSVVMLQYQYRMHPSLADFPAEYFYNVNSGKEAGVTKPSGNAGLQTRASQSWTGIRGSRFLKWAQNRYWNGINTHLLAEESAYTHMAAVNANVLHGCWPGIRTRDHCWKQGFVYSTLPEARPEELHLLGEEERVVFLNICGREKRTTVASAEGHEDSRGNEREAETAVRVYKAIIDRLHTRRFAESSIGVLSQYRYQVSIIKKMLQDNGFQNPTVQTVIASQGSEFDYVILSLVRSLPDYEIPAFPLPGWENKFLGFITDENQINVALTRARRGLIIIGNRNLLRTNRMWSCLLHHLDERGCIPAQPDDFPDRSGDRRPMTRCAGLSKLQGAQFNWRDEQQCFWPVNADRDLQRDWAPRVDPHLWTATGAPVTQGQLARRPPNRPFAITSEEFPALR